LSFWIALAVGPLACAAALALAAAASAPAEVETAQVTAADPALAQRAEAAVLEAARLEGRKLALAKAGEAATMRVTLRADAAGGLSLSFAGAHPLSPLGQALVERTLERVGDTPTVRLATPPPAERVQTHTDFAAVGRFAQVMMLWL